MEIPDSHRMEVVIVAQQYKTTVPYSATLTKKFYDGSKSKQIISGMYNGVNIDEVKVEYGAITPLVSLAEDLVRRKRRQVTPCGDYQKICGEGARCANTAAGFDCVCNEGFSGDGEVCVRTATDACSRLNPCPLGIECLNDPQDDNEFECLCPENHRYENNKCEPIIPDILYKLIDAHEFIWTATGKMPLSIYRVRQFQMDFCSPGDIAVTSLPGDNQPMLKHVLLKSVKDGSLAMPESVELAQTTEDGVKIFDLIPREGYTCLGSIAVKKDEEPDVARYCCPRNEYLIEADMKAIFKWARTTIYSSSRTSPAGVIASTFKTSISPSETVGKVP